MVSARTGRQWLAASGVAVAGERDAGLGVGVYGESPARLALRELARNPGAVFGAGILLVIVVAALFAPVLAPFDPIALSPVDSSQAPSASHLMGTDVLGRDVFSRVIHGARISLWLGLVSVGIACSLGMTLGMIAGYFGGWAETVIMRGADMMLAFPSFLLALTILFALGQSIVNVMIAVGLASVPGYTRIVRGSVLATREQDFVVAARTIGCSDGRLMRRHILPNVVAPVIVISSVGIAWAIITAASLSFLGMGVQPPTPEWGSMVNDGMRHLRRAWWISSFPALAIVVTVLAINLIGDGLRDALDPKLRHVQ
jgi:peptide/nickel transport system permease protein